MRISRRAMMAAMGAGVWAQTRKFEPTWDSLSGYHCPEWFRNAKFGIWAHWGPQCVPMQGDWYARNMYLEGQRAYEFHKTTYGHPSKFGYKDIIPLWKAERFEPERLMKLYKGAGARYFVSMGVHHDNFDLWNSKHNPWNAAKMGPKRDVLGAWQKAAKAEGLKFGVSEHLAASFTWWQGSHGSDKKGDMAGVPYDGADPKYESLYHWKAAEGDKAWYTTDPKWAAHWSDRIHDLLDQYEPDLLYSDGSLPFGEVGRRMLAHFYNANAARHGGKVEAVYCLKDWRTRPGHGDYVEGIGVQDVERGGLSGIKAAAWQTDTAIGDWFYNKNWKAKDTGTMYRSAKWVVQTLTDVVSKNGNLLLNVIQRPDGALDPEVETLLGDLTVWMKANGEAIFETRPWGIHGEGAAKTEAGHFKEDFGFTGADVRFTARQDGRGIYAVTLGKPAGTELKIRALAMHEGGGKVEQVELLGQKGALPFTQTAEALTVKLPESGLSEMACGFRVSGRNLKAKA